MLRRALTFIVLASLSTAGCAYNGPAAPAPIVFAPAAASSFTSQVAYGFGTSAGYAFVTVYATDARGAPAATPIIASVSSGGIAPGFVFSAAFGASVQGQIPSPGQFQATVTGHGPITLTLTAPAVAQAVQLTIP